MIYVPKPPMRTSPPWITAHSSVTAPCRRPPYHNRDGILKGSANNFCVPRMGRQQIALRRGWSLPRHKDACALWKIVPTRGWILGLAGVSLALDMTSFCQSIPKRTLIAHSNHANCVFTVVFVLAVFCGLFGCFLVHVIWYRLGFRCCTGSPNV